MKKVWWVLQEIPGKTVPRMIGSGESRQQFGDFTVIDTNLVGPFKAREDAILEAQSLRVGKVTIFPESR